MSSGPLLMGDVVNDVWEAIEAIPDCPDMMTATPADLFEWVDALEAAVAELKSRTEVFAANARHELTEWTNHHERNQQ